MLRAAQVKVPAGAVENGEVRQPEAVAEALRELWARGKFKSKQVVMGVGNQRVVVREIGLPWLPEKELRDSLGFQVQEFIPMSVDEVVLDFDTLGEFEQEGRRMLRILLVAAQRVDGGRGRGGRRGGQARAGRARPGAVRARARRRRDRRGDGARDEPATRP